MAGLAPVAGRVDGRLVAHFTGFNWRTTNDLRINTFWLKYYVTRNSTSIPVSTMYFDDVVVARKYIGPIVPAKR